MRIDAVETIRPIDHPNLCIVQIHAGDLSGIGETFFGGDTVETFIHEQAATHLIGEDPRELTRLGRSLETYLGHTGSGVERRGRSAIDLALWDILGKHAGLPLATLLGGQVTRRVPTYNTCAGPRYVRSPSGQESSNWGLGTEGRHEDLHMSIHQPVELAHELIDDGFQAMKIWPFDKAAEMRKGTIPTVADIAAGVAPIEAIRNAIGDGIEIMVEMHGLWGITGARLIIDALEDYSPLWIEDPVKPTDVDALAALTSGTPIPIAAGETIGDPVGYLSLAKTRAADVIVVDVGWCGGIGSALGIAQLASWQQLPVAFHDCSGPIQFTASVHLAASVENATIQEMVRAFFHGWYEDLVSNLPVFDQGSITPPPGPGLGIELREGLSRRADVRSRMTN